MAFAARTPLPSRGRAVVVGGGIAGCSVLYHLAKLGWTDSVLVEKGELTSGSTWHAAGLCTQLNPSRPLTKLLMRSLELYESLERDGGHEVGLRRVGSVRLATSTDRLDELAVRAGLARSLDLPFEILDARAVGELLPLVRTDDVLGAAYLPTDGYIDASQVTSALADEARRLGAAIHRRTRVTEVRPNTDGWTVVTDRGDIECEVVVNAAGQWARQIGEMVGVKLPIVSLQHQYVVTAEISEITELAVEPPVLRDPDASFYVRQEGNGLLIGPFERDALPWKLEGVPLDFEGRLLPENLEQIMPVLQEAARRVPVLDEAGLKSVINGPDGYTPDGWCLMGEVPDRRGFHVLAGFSIFGIVFAGGAGEYAAEWIVHGQPSDSLWELDVRRFGPFSFSTGFVAARAREVYEREYAIHYPEEETPAGRPLKTDPLYDRLRERKAVFGARFGWERPLFFAHDAAAPVDEYSFRVPGWHDDVARECRNVRAAGGVIDQTSFAKYEIRGPGAEPLLQRLCANHLPEGCGRIVLSQMLTPEGGIECDVTVTRLDDDRFYVVSAAATEEHDLAWITRQSQGIDGVEIENLTARTGVLSIAGPCSRELLGRLARDDVSADAFRFFTAREMELASVPSRVMRLSYVGELGFEVHHPIEYSRALYEEMLRLGHDLGICDFGYRALESMRLEKGYRLWGTDILSDTSPLEAGLDLFVDWDATFLGKEALERQRDRGVERLLVTLALDDERVVYPHQYEPVVLDGGVVSWVMAGGYGHTVGRPIALAYLPIALARDGQELEVRVVGEALRAQVTTRPLHDPDNVRLRL